MTLWHWGGCLEDHKKRKEKEKQEKNSKPQNKDRCFDLGKEHRALSVQIFVFLTAN